MSRNIRAIVRACKGILPFSLMARANGLIRRHRCLRAATWSAASKSGKRSGCPSYARASRGTVFRGESGRNRTGAMRRWATAANSTRLPKKFCSRRKKFEHGAARLPGSQGDTSMSGSKLSIKELAQLRGDERKETLIRGATEEGNLTFSTTTAPEDIQSLLMAFEMRFPFIRSEMV